MNAQLRNMRKSNAKWLCLTQGCPAQERSRAVMAQNVSLWITAPRWGSRETSGTKGRGGIRRADGAAETHGTRQRPQGQRGLRRSGQHDQLRVRIRHMSTLRAEPPMASRSLSMKAKVLPSPRALLHPSPSSIRAPCSALHRPRTPRPGPSSFPKRRIFQRLHRAYALTASGGRSNSIFPEAGLDAPGMKLSPLAPRPCPLTQMTFLLLFHSQLPSHVSSAYCARPRAEDPGPTCSAPSGRGRPPEAAAGSDSPSRLPLSAAAPSPPAQRPAPAGDAPGWRPSWRGPRATSRSPSVYLHAERRHHLLFLTSLRRRSAPAGARQQHEGEKEVHLAFVIVAFQLSHAFWADKSVNIKAADETSLG